MIVHDLILCKINAICDFFVLFVIDQKSYFCVEIYDNRDQPRQPRMMF